MTRQTNARLAGFAFLFYIAAGVTSLVLSNRATGGEGIAAKLVSIAQHPADMRVIVLLTVLTTLSAWVLGVTLYAITKEQDPDLAMLGLICRVGEGLIGAAGIRGTLALLWLATATGANAPDRQAAHALGQFLLGDSATISATFFAVGSTLFAWLLLGGRMIPIPLAWIGVAASILLVVGLPLQLAGVLRGPVAQLMWIPMVAFEIPLAVWLIVKGVAVPAARPKAA